MKKTKLPVNLQEITAWMSRISLSWRDAVASQALDLLHFPDIGMAPFTYGLAHSRIAPVQTVTTRTPASISKQAHHAPPASW